MALVHSKFKVTFNFVDSGENSTSRTIELNAATAVEAATEANALAIDLDAISDAVIASYTIGDVFEEDAFTLPVGSVNVEEAAEITMFLEGFATKKAVFSVPSPVIDIFVGTSGKNRNIVDGLDTLVVNLLENFKPGFTAFISDGENAKATLPFVSGKRVHYRSRKG